MSSKKEAVEKPSVLAQVVALEHMELEALKVKYEALFGREPPTRTRKHIIARLAYRIQELAYGGLSAEARARLEAIYEGKGLPGQTTGPAKKD